MKMFCLMKKPSCMENKEKECKKVEVFDFVNEGKSNEENVECKEKRIYCKVCGKELDLSIEKHYICRTNSLTGLQTIVTKEEETIYDAFDCENCGCQNIVGERKRIMNENEDDIALYEGEENEEEN